MISFADPARRPPAPPRAAGFTLIELLVALAILGFALALIARYRPVAFTLDLAHRRYRIGDKPAHSLPAGLAVRILTIAGEQPGPDAAAIRFNPDGSATGGRITLAADGREIAIGVDWLTGRVAVAETR